MYCRIEILCHVVFNVLVTYMYFESAKLSFDKIANAILTSENRNDGTPTALAGMIERQHEDLVFGNPTKHIYKSRYQP